MLILHLIDSLSPERGGPPESVRQIVKAHIAVGTNVEVVCLDHPDEDFLREISCPVHALGESFLGRYAFSPQVWRWLNENLYRFDGIVMHGIWSFPNIALRVAARRARKSYGVFVHGALDPWFNRKYPLKYLKKLMYWPWQYLVLHSASAVFFTSELERDLASTSFWPNVWNSIVIPYGVSDPEGNGSDPRSQTEAFYRLFPRLRGRRYLLFLGRLHEKKGCDLLVEAFAQTVTVVPDLDLLMAGPDPDGMQAKLASRTSRLGVSGRVHWTGMIGGDIKWGALRTCEAFVLPSHQENFGISVVEALAVGRPVLISNQVNIWHEIETDGVGLIGEDTLEGTANLLRRWFETPPVEREAMAGRARPCFLNRFTMNRAAAAIRDHFAASSAEDSAASS